jgi:hypothetical protein
MSVLAGVGRESVSSGLQEDDLGVLKTWLRQSGRRLPRESRWDEKVMPLSLVLSTIGNRRLPCMLNGIRDKRFEFGFAGRFTSWLAADLRLQLPETRFHLLRQ